MYRRTNTTPASALAVQAVLAVTLIATAAGQTPTYSVVYRFDPTIGRSLPVIEGPEGGIFGATRGPESGSSSCSGYGCGLVYKLDPGTGELTILHVFDETDGAYPYSGKLVRARPTGSYTVLYRFKGGPSDPGGPAGPLIRDNAGNLYGTAGGGTSECGTIFKLTPAGTETVLYNFPDCSAGSGYGLVEDAAGNLYGAAGLGGASGLGSVYKLDTSGVFTELYSFTGGADGGEPSGPLFLDAATGNLFGTAQVGGLQDCSIHSGGGCGVVFEVSPSGVETVVHSFTGSGQGSYPGPDLLGRPASGGGLEFLGVTSRGGMAGCGTGNGCGIIYSLIVP